MLIVNLPIFPGFYCSHLEYHLDYAVEYELDFRDKDHPANLDWGAMRREVAEAWVSALSTHLENLVEDCQGPKFEPLKFHRLVHPREYNFSTDQVDALISPDEVKWLFDNTSHADLDGVARLRHTSCDGFISFYNPDYRTWGEVTSWDLHQLGTLLQAFLVGPEPEDMQELLVKLEDDLVDQGDFSEIAAEHVYQALRVSEP